MRLPCPYNLKEYFNDKETILDVKARDSHKRIIDIEIQISAVSILPIAVCSTGRRTIRAN